MTPTPDIASGAGVYPAPSNLDLQGGTYVRQVKVLKESSRGEDYKNWVLPGGRILQVQNSGWKREERMNLNGMSEIRRDLVASHLRSQIDTLQGLLKGLENEEEFNEFWMSEDLLLRNKELFI